PGPFQIRFLRPMRRMRPRTSRSLAPPHRSVSEQACRSPLEARGGNPLREISRPKAIGVPHAGRIRRSNSARKLRPRAAQDFDNYSTGFLADWVLSFAEIPNPLF